MALYPNRSDIAYLAKSKGVENFMAMQMPNGWKLVEMPGKSPAAEWAKDKDFVGWVESQYIDEGRKPGIQGVVVVNLTREEIAEEDIPSEFIVVPRTPSLWGANTEKSEQLEATGSVLVNGRVRSAIESPVKLVHRLADEMKGASRAEVIAACIAAGVNKSTAQTQYYKWNKAQST